MTTNSLITIKRGRQKRQRRWLLVNLLLIITAMILCVAMLLLGNTFHHPADVFRALTGETVEGVSFAVNNIRLPRMLAGLLAGIAFGIAGNTFQTMLRNPLANPEILGITAGSSVAALFCILILQTSQTVTSFSAVIAGLLTVIVIYFLSRSGSFSIGRLILVGIGIQAMLSAVISYLLMVGGHQDLPSALRWLSGSLNGVQMNSLAPLVLVVVIFLPIIIFLGRHLQLLELGEQAAISLGLRTDLTRVLLIVSSVCMIAFATSVTGPIAFVAFLAGPIAKRIAGVGYSNVLPAGLVGANLVLAADLIGQFAFDVRFPVGIITGILGAPFLLYLLIRMNRRGSL
ncbi:FecCD family ABC transporter permease [Geomicrobium sediminis]|uniref:Iron complex transport system permease protein n=1 Tax=Geomicrobium sediminis TaxID=1347788 RepID=A0ABS2PD67_9BACL|nr:iron chelate uptake ABC transporter family permease subunit [Geomicrobium sediminis]MBM7633061.1 iron complex transport system permease protein [Geomicrobium sediminis]